MSDIEKGSTKPIMLVDDQVVLLDVLSEMLQRLGYQCVMESDPRKAIDTILEKGNELSLVITDYAMPEVTGITLIHSCFATHPDLPFVLSTGYGTNISESDDASIENEVRATLPKPYNMKAIRELLAEIFGSENP